MPQIEINEIQEERNSYQIMIIRKSPRKSSSKLFRIVFEPTTIFLLLLFPISHQLLQISAKMKTTEVKSPLRISSSWKLMMLYTREWRKQLCRIEKKNVLTSFQLISFFLNHDENLLKQNSLKSNFNDLGKNSFRRINLFINIKKLFIYHKMALSNNRQ